MSELRAEPGATQRRWPRRALTLPAYLLLTPIWIGLLPLSVPVLACVDAVRGTPWAATRTAIFAGWYLLCESLGLIACFGLWLVGRGADSARVRGWHQALQNRWAASLFAGARVVFGFRVETEGEGCASEKGPVLVFIRHASLADTLLPAVLLAARHGWRLRYVLKRELLWDPCLDVVGHRLPNVFVQRGSGDAAREVGRLRELARGMAADEGVLIYPEGTRFTPERRARALARLAEAGDADLLERARALERVLPPRLGGPLGLLDECPNADVLFLAHVGFDGVSHARDLLDGALVGRRVRVALWRVRAGEIPTTRAAREGWLYDEWLRLDRWVAAQEAA